MVINPYGPDQEPFLAGGGDTAPGACRARRHPAGHAKLIRKGMIYSAAHGELAFTVPLFDEFMIREMATFE